MAAWSLDVPSFAALFEQVAAPSNVRALGLIEVLDWTADTLNRSVAPSFSRASRRNTRCSISSSRSLSLRPGAKKELGVWYTPEEIVRYMVERVDRVLRTELGIADGLADERVYVLDPCCGTGAYLVEVLRRIKRTIDEQGGDALLARDLKRAARERSSASRYCPRPSSSRICSSACCCRRKAARWERMSASACF